MTSERRQLHPRAGHGISSALRLAVVVGLAVALLSGCAGDLNTPGEALRILGATLPQAYVGQAYSQPIQAVGGLRPYGFSLAEGHLPPGIELRWGTLRGVPRKVGRYTFTLQIADANLSKTVRKYTLAVTEVPPPKLTFHVPMTQVDRRVTLRAQVSDARQLEGLRTEVRWDPKRFRLVDGSVSASRRGLALLQQAASGQLQVALAPLGTRIDGQAMLFRFELEPVAGASYLEIDTRTEFASASARHFARRSEGRRPPRSPSTSAGATTPEAASENHGGGP